MVTNFRGSKPWKKQQASDNNNQHRESVAFMQVVAGRDGKTHSRITCHACHKKGHYANQCPQAAANTNVETTKPNTTTTDASDQASTAGTAHVNITAWNCFTTCSTIQGAAMVTFREKLRTWLLLDNQSTDNIFCNRKYLQNIRQTKETLDLTSNGGTLKINHKANFPGFGEVWYDPRGVTNIISQADVERKGYEVVYDNKKQEYIVSGKRGKIYFQLSPEGLYYMSLEPLQSKGITLVETVEQNKMGFSKRQVERADRAKRLYEMIGFPSMKDYKTILQMNGIRNCPVTVDDVKICEKIYGPSVPALKGKSVRTKPNVVVKDYVEVPKELKLQNEDVELCADILYIQKEMFLATVSKHLKFLTIVPIAQRSKKMLCDAFDQTFRVYNASGFRIASVHVDPEFKPLEDIMRDDDNDIAMIYVPAQQHVPEIERAIRTIKERYRAMYHSLPYKAIPKIMIKAAAKRAVKWLNMFPPKGGVSKYFSPRAIVTGCPLDYNNNCKHSFGAYVQALQENVPTNSPAPRTLDCIFLDSEDNPAGGFQLLHLASNKVITRRKITEIPLTEAVIHRVEELAKKEGIPNKLTFLFRHRGKFVTDDDAFLAGVDEYQHNNKDNNENENNYEEDDEQDDYEYESQEDDYDYDEESIESNEIRKLKEELQERPVAIEDNQTIVEPDGEESVHSVNDIIQELQNRENEIEEELQSIQEELERPKRVRKPNEVMNIGDMQSKSYTSTNINTTSIKPDLEYDDAEAVVLANIMISMVQTYSLKAGIKKFGQKGKDSALVEMKQLHDRSVFCPRDPRQLTDQQRQRALESLIFITEKRDGRIKARACANGSKQRNWMSREDTSSPTVSLQSVFLTCAIEAYEERDVAVVDIPNAFVQTDHEGETVYMKVRGELAKILVEIAPEIYEKYLVYENGVPVLYLEILRALYGMLESSMLFYKKLLRDLEKEGFEVNPYDPCVANKIVDGKQLTVTWHVDDLKVSHVKTEVIDDFIQWVRDKYEDFTKVKPSRGKKHDYLAMLLDYSTPGVVKIDMSDYIRKILKEFQYLKEVGTTGAKTPAAEYLFKTNEECKKLKQDKKEEFHTTVAKMLFLCCRSRPDIKCAVSFLCTRVQQPDEDDWKKMIRVLKYLRSTKDLTLTIKAEDILNPKWWADAAFAVHPDMKSHTGGVMTLGKGMIQSISRKQKLNTKSSTEAELVGADDILSDLLWTRNFLEAQGYPSKSTLLLQDNTSAILLEKNGHESAGKRSRHIDIRYFFIKDCIDKRKLEVKFCPTDDMVADFFTKPLQGAKFMKFRKTIMNL